MKKLILNWLFGIDDTKSYMELLKENMGYCDRCVELLDDHKKTLEDAKWALNNLRKLIRICENHGIDVDEEIKHIRLYEVNANEKD